jgi:hypothetical protein
MLNIAYGLSCDSGDDPLLIRMENFMTTITQAANPTKFLVVSLVLA